VHNIGIYVSIIVYRFLVFLKSNKKMAYQVSACMVLVFTVTCPRDDQKITSDLCLKGIKRDHMLNYVIHEAFWLFKTYVLSVCV